MIEADKLFFESHDVKIRFTMSALGITRAEAEDVWRHSDQKFVEVVDIGDEHD